MSYESMKLEVFLDQGPGPCNDAIHHDEDHLLSVAFQHLDLHQDIPILQAGSCQLQLSIHERLLTFDTGA